MVMLTWLAQVLRDAGLEVVEHDGWETRGRSEMGAARGILVHHTGGPLTGDTPSLNLVLKGREDLPGPLSQLFLARSGVWNVLAAGRCNHAGAGAWQGITAGNSNFIGVEAENAGTPADPWPTEQMESYARGCAAILKHIGADVIMVAGHREYALPKGRKIDPLFDMIEFRENVAARMQGFTAAQIHPAPKDPTRLMLRKGDRGEDVIVLQLKLGLVKDGVFGPKTEEAVKAWQTGHQLKPDGLVGPATWKSLGV